MAAVAMVMEEGKEHGGGFALEERGGGDNFIGVLGRFSGRQIARTSTWRV